VSLTRFHKETAENLGLFNASTHENDVLRAQARVGRNSVPAYSAAWRTFHSAHYAEANAPYAGWNLLKGHFFRAVEKSERVSESRGKRRERGLWQRRFWAHLITDQVTLTATWIASTGTLSNMAGQSGLPIGRIRAFTTLWNEVFIQPRGGIQGNSNLMQVNDSKDAVRHPSGGFAVHQFARSELERAKHGPKGESHG
jgi:hypothetical protein